MLFMRNQVCMLMYNERLGDLYGRLLWENYMHDYVVIGMIVMSLFNVVYECVNVVICGLVHLVH